MNINVKLLFITLSFAVFFFILMAGGCKKKDHDTDTGPVTGTVKDIEGNTYKTIKIANQTWIAENLKTTTYNDGTPILLADSQDVWGSCSVDSIPCYCWLNNDMATYGDLYGALYNGFAALTGKLCPTGWHVPTDLDWQTLERFLGMSQEVAASKGTRGTDEGGKLKEMGTANWAQPNTGATNSSGFTARPGSVRNAGGYMSSSLGLKGCWYTSTTDEHHQVWFREMKNDYSKIGRYAMGNGYGYSVRCVKN